MRRLAKLFNNCFHRESPLQEPMRALDDVAEAIRSFRSSSRRTTPVVRSIALRDQFSLPVTPSVWLYLEKELNHSLPPLCKSPQGLWDLPLNWQTVFDLAEYVAQRSDRIGPKDYSTAEWVNAQIFAGVRTQLLDALNLKKCDIHRKSRLEQDLGAA